MAYSVAQNFDGVHGGDASGEGSIRVYCLDLAEYLYRNEPSLIPQKSWRCRGAGHTQIENELMELFLFSLLVKLLKIG